MQLRIKDINVKINTLFLATIVILISAKPDNTIAIALISSTLHEIGHLVVMLYFKQNPQSICFSFFGMRITKQSDLSLSFKKEIIVSIAGITVNFIIFVVFAICYAIFKTEIFLKISSVNLLLGGFNLLPIYVLDGGRVLEYALKLHFDQQKSEKLLNIVSVIFLLPLYFFGFYTLISTGYNFTLLVVAIYLTIILITSLK